MPAAIHAPDHSLGMREIHVYSRRGCHLCEVLIEELSDLLTGHAELRVHDVDTRVDWCEAFGLRVPVVEYRGKAVCDGKLDRDAVMAALAEPV